MLWISTGCEKEIILTGIFKPGRAIPKMIAGKYHTRFIMDRDPLISVIMSAYAEPAEWLSLSINSILRQSYENYEFIVINDNPERVELRDILNKYAANDNRVIIYENLENQGLTKSLNIGLGLTRGEYIARMDADDISLPDRFSEQIRFMEKHPEVGVCGTWVKYFDESRKKCKRPLEDQALKDDFINYNPFVHPTVLIRKSVLSDHNIKYNEEWKFAQDKQLWLELMDFTAFANIPKILYRYRISKKQLSNNNMEQIRCSNRTKLHYIEKEFGPDVLKAISESQISINTIQAVGSLLQGGNPATKNRLIGNLYLSLHRYSLRSLFYCIFSGDVFKYKLGLIIPFKILKRIFSFNVKYTRIQVID
jgi:glycosyltransferase involved in cell wall biosynthesis